MLLALTTIQLAFAMVATIQCLRKRFTRTTVLASFIVLATVIAVDVIQGQQLGSLWLAATSNPLHIAAQIAALLMAPLCVLLNYVHRDTDQPQNRGHLPIVTV